MRGVALKTQVRHMNRTRNFEIISLLMLIFDSDDSDNLSLSDLLDLRIGDTSSVKSRSF